MIASSRADRTWWCTCFFAELSIASMMLALGARGVPFVHPSAPNPRPCDAATDSRGSSPQQVRRAGGKSQSQAGARTAAGPAPQQVEAAGERELPERGTARTDAPQAHSDSHRNGMTMTHEETGMGGENPWVNRVKI